VGELERLRKDVTYVRYDGEGHAFSTSWAASMERTVAFLRRHV
jgi:dipeptidyl aminopeptidase/acylaminoacyl peptidase